MKKLFAVLAITLFAFSFMAIAQETGATETGVQADAQAQVEVQADAQLPEADVAKPKLHTLFITSAQGIGVDSSDSANFVIARVVAGRIVLTKRQAQAQNQSENGDDEARCNEKGRCFTVRKTGVLTIASKESVTSYHMRNIVVGEGTVSAELFKANSSVGSITLTLVEMAGANNAWTGVTEISGTKWNIYVPFKAHARLVKPAMVRKAMEVGNKCGLTRPLDTAAVRECVASGGKAAIKQVEGCPQVECVKSEKPVIDTAGLKARCEAKGGVLVKHPLKGSRIGFTVVCIVGGRIDESAPESAGATPTASVEATATASPTPSVEASASPTVSAQASVNASVAAGTG